MLVIPTYDDAIGWVPVPGLLAPEDAERLAAACDDIAANLRDPRGGDKPHGNTRRITALDERLPETNAVADALGPVIDQILGPRWAVTEIAFRSPGPGTGGQQLHADDVPRTDAADPSTGATAIVALATFSEESGATRLVPGSHRRVDQQRMSQSVDHLPGEEYLTGTPGTGFVFDRHVLHGGSLNRSSRPRPALQISYRPLT